MMRSTFGAPLGGTIRGGHQGVESLALSLITPPNFGGGGGSCFPSMVVVALGAPSVPVTCCAAAGATANITTRKNAATSARNSAKNFVALSSLFILCLFHERAGHSSLTWRTDSASPALPGFHH